MHVPGKKMGDRLGQFAGVLAVGACLLLTLAATAMAAAPAFVPIQLQKIMLPSSVKNAGQPVYSHDGRHLLFWGNSTDGGPLHLWIVGINGTSAHCLSCGSSEPKMQPGELEQPGLITPFPDGKRVFYGPYGDPRVLECSPSVLDCKTKQTLSIGLSGARPSGPIAPGGVDSGGTLYQNSAATPKLSPDGKWIAFSDIRSDAIEVMVLARLTRAGDQYVTSDARVLNPPGPTSSTDLDVVAWSRSAALFEFKTFLDGGRAISYVQVGGEAGNNPDLWKLDLRTGQRTRLTANPDWQEDMAVSPDGKSMLVGVDAAGLHYVDAGGGLLPFRSFFDAPEVAGSAGADVAGAKLRACARFAPRLLPASGDDDAKLIGQVVNPYAGGQIRDAGSVEGWPMWSPDSTSIALSTQSLKTFYGARYLEIAHLVRAPSKPLPVASSEPGAWAPTQSQYHGAMGFTGDITLHGQVSGTVALHEANPLGAISGTDSATYVNYSDDGKSFLNGTTTLTNSLLTTQPVHVVTNLTLTGAHHGSLHSDMTYDLTKATQTGTQTATYDGATLHGPLSHAQLCASIRNVLPRPITLGVAAHRRGHEEVVVKVTASYAGTGANERSIDRRPLRDATVTLAGKSATTDAHGIAVIVSAHGTSVRVSAGATFKVTTATVT